jgi:lysozyme family protein
VGLLTPFSSAILYVRERAAALVKEAEMTIPGASGPEKRRWVVNKLDETISLPKVLDDVFDIDGLFLARVVDAVCDHWNLLTGGDIAGSKLEPFEVAHAVDLPLEVMVAAAPKGNETAADIDARLHELFKQYGITGTTEIEVHEPPKPPAPTNRAEEKAADALLTVKAENWSKSIAITRAFEGGWSNDPADKGGKTNYGITEGTLITAYALGIVSHNDIRKLTPTEAEYIYKVQYWDKYSWGNVQWYVCFLGFDATVNGGIGMAAKVFQRSINQYSNKFALAEDGKWGPKTAGAVSELFSITAKAPSAASLKTFGDIYLKYRLEYYRNIVKRDPTQQKFINGWTNRLKKIAAQCNLTFEV